MADEKKNQTRRVSLIEVPEAEGKFKRPSFRGTPRTEESLLLPCTQAEEGFLTSFGMTIKSDFSANCKTANHKDF